MPTHTKKERAKKKGPTVKKTVARKKSALDAIMGSIRAGRPKKKKKS